MNLKNNGRIFFFNLKKGDQIFNLDELHLFLMSINSVIHFKKYDISVQEKWTFQVPYRENDRKEVTRVFSSFSVNKHIRLTQNL